MKAGQSGIPGFEFLERVGIAWQRAMTDHARIANAAWDQMRTGKYDHAAMVANWTKVTEAYFPALVEGFRGPGYVREPVWVYFTFDRRLAVGKDGKPAGNPLEKVVTIPRMESEATELDATTFASMHGEKPIDDLYTTCDWADDDTSRTQIKIVLDRTKLAAANGQYISIIMPKNRGPESPLVIVMLRVTTP
jgi:hypothetical protein